MRSTVKTPRWPSSRRKRWLLLILLLLAIFALDFAFYPSFLTLPGPSPDRGENGLWLRYTWYFGKRKDYQALADRLQRERIASAYFHVRFIDANGHLHFRYPQQAKTLVTEMHRRAPGVKLIAWIYVGNRDGGGNVVLGDEKARANMEREAVWLCRDCGFDGVQWDYEICRDGDRDFLALLDETRARLPSGKILSVATPVWAPGGHIWAWTDGYFRQVAKRSDQMAVMAYDTGMWWPRAYDWLVQEQVAHVTADAAVNPRCRVLIGVPTYVQGGPSHKAWAENIGVALHGVREGYRSLPEAERGQFAGVAVFADYTTTAKDWRTYETTWSPHPQPLSRRVERGVSNGKLR